MKHPCTKECPDRTITCKSTCEKYKDYMAKTEKERQYRIAQHKINDYQFDMKRRNIKKYGGK